MKLLVLMLIVVGVASQQLRLFRERKPLKKGVDRREFRTRPGRYYVDPLEGSDEYTGSHPRWMRGLSRGPFRTVRRAIQVARMMRKMGEYDRVNIFLRGGNRRIYSEDPIVLDERDSKTKIMNYRKDETAIFDGSDHIPGGDFKVVKISKAYSVFRAKFKGECSMNAYIGTDRLIRARKPNVRKWDGNNFSGEGPYLKIKDILKSTPTCDNKSSGGFRQSCPDENKLGFVFDEGDISNKLKQRHDEIDIVVFQSWNAERGRVKEIVRNNNTVLFQQPLRYAIGSHPTSSGWRYIVENSFVELDSPGEFYCDEKKKLFYVALPRSHRRILRMTGIRIPKQLRHIIVRGAKDILIEGLTFKKTDREGQGFHEAPAAIEIYNSRDIQINRCEFEDIGHNAVYVVSSVNVLIQKNYFYRMGYMGVGVDYMNSPESENATRNIYVHRNTMTMCGMTNMFQPSCIHVRGARNINVNQNDIYKTCYSGIRVGWQKMFTKDYVGKNEKVFKIQRNHVYNYGRGILNDFGGIYLGTNQDDCKINQRAEICHVHALVRENVIHDSTSYYYGGSGVYGDSATSSLTIERNWIYRLVDGAILFHCGINNLAKNNVIFHTVKRRLIGTCNHVMRGANGLLPRQEFSVIGNVFYIDNKEATMWRKGDTWNFDEPKFDFNVYFFSHSLPNQTSVFFPKRKSWMEWRIKQDRNGMIADPKLINIDEGNLRIRANSPLRSKLPAVANLNLNSVKETSGVPKLLFLGKPPK